MNWKQYKTRPNKIQFINAGLEKAFNTSYCVTFSKLKMIQAKMNKKAREGMDISWARSKGYLNANGEFDFSPRYTGTMADTTIYGNNQWNVDNCIVAYGLIPETMHPNKADSWAEYADESKITKEMKDLGDEFTSRYDIDSFFTTSLDESPLQGIVRYMDGSGILSPEGKTNHALMVENEEPDYFEVSDTFWQEEKKYAKDKVFYLKGFTIKEKTMTQEQITKFLKDNDKKYCRNKTTGAFGRILQGQLFTLHSTDRAVLCLLDDKVREGGIQIDILTWEALPKKEF